jgi:hypothetical protein
MEQTMANRDRRKQPRHKIWINAKVITPDNSISAIATNLSVDGLGVLAPNPILPEANVNISLHLQEEIVLSGTVLWTVDIYAGWGIIYQIGIRIDGIVRADIDKNVSIGLTGSSDTTVVKVLEKPKLLKKILSLIKGAGGEVSTET